MVPKMAESCPRARRVVVGEVKAGGVGEVKAQRKTGQVDIMMTKIRPIECLSRDT